MLTICIDRINEVAAFKGERLSAIIVKNEDFTFTIYNSEGNTYSGESFEQACLYCLGNML